MPRTITTAGSLIAILSCLAAGCLSGDYDKDFQARLKQYRQEAAGEPPAAEEAPADPAPPPAEGGDG